MKQTKPRWMRLDNAAKIYPAAKRRNWSNMFRISASLSAPIDPEILQLALNATVGRFPSIAVRLRRGVFWYYLEELTHAPKIRSELSWPCARTAFSDIRKCAFRIFYYENRIAAEFFHALTDGSGGLVFLKTLVAEYLTQKYGISITNSNGVLDRDEEPTPEELEDSFLKHVGFVSGSRREATAYRLSGTKEKDGYHNIVTGILDVDEVLKNAKEYKVSMTAYLVAVLIASIIEIQNEKQPDRRKQRPVKVLIPVNLRNYFNSKTLRNFALFVTPSIDPKMGVYSFAEIVKSVHHQMGFELNQKNLSTKITANVRAEKSLFIKIMPLFLKNAVMKTVYNIVGEKKSCLSFSNLGAVSLPSEMHDYVSRLDFVLGVQASIPNNCGVLSYNGKLYINFIRNIEEPVLERKFFTYLRKQGLIAKIESNQKERGR